MTAPTPALADLVSAAVTRLGAAWSCTPLLTRTAIRYSPRLKRSLARANTRRAVITLSPDIPAEPAIVDEVRCHEFAHLVAHARVGGTAAPHGPTWQALVRQAGHEPSLRLRIESKTAATSLARPELGTSRLPRRYAHHCPVCHFTRQAGRPMQRWRCADCHAAGLDGLLDITEIRS